MYFRTLLVALMLVVVPAKADSWEDKLPQQSREWLASGDLTVELDLLLEAATHRYLSDTPYAGRIRINLPPAPHQATFLMVRRAALSKFDSNLKCTCSVSVKQETILCDADFVNDFLNVVNTGGDFEKAQGDDRDALLELNANYKSFLLNWLFGHEIGHLVLRHNLSAPPAVPSAPLAQSVADPTVKQWGRQEEFEADSYVLSRLSRSSIQFSAFMTLSQMATSLYDRLIRLQNPGKLETYPKGGPDPIFGALIDVDLRYSPAAHPPWFIRVLDMADLLFKHYPNMVDTSGYWQRLRSRIHAVNTGSTQPKDWSCAENLNGTPATALTGHSLVGDAELLDRVLDVGDDELSKRRISGFRDQALASGQTAAWTDAYQAFIEADNHFRHGRFAEADAAITRGAASYGTNYPDDLSFLVLHARTVARTERNSVKRTAVINELLPRIDKAATALSDFFQSHPRELLAYYLDMWEVLVRARSLEDSTAQELLSRLTETLAANAYDMVSIDLMGRWREMIKALPRAADEQSTELRINQLLQFTAVAKKLGMRADAIAANREALTEMDEAVPDQIVVRAYWRDNLVRLLMETNQTRECATVALEAEALRGQILDLVRKQQPDQLDDAIGQAGIAANQVGFCYILATEWKSAAEALEQSLKEEQSRKHPNEEELATVQHNLATADVALGKATEAVYLANLAFINRQRLKVSAQLIENSRSVLAAALYLNGQREESIRMLKTWQDRMMEIDDFRAPTDDLIFFIDGKEVGLRDLLGASNITSDRIKPSTANAFDYGAALSVPW